MDELLDLNLLRVLVAVDDWRSVTRAARQLGRSQPAASAALARLREQFRDPLFVRSGSVMTPTPRAVEVLHTARTVLQLVDGSIAAPARFDPATSTLPVRLALSDVGEIIFLPRILQLLQQQMPAATLSAVSLSADAIAREMEAGHIDLAVGHFPDLGGQSFKQQVLFRDSFACLIRADHPIQSRQLTLEQFRRLEHAVVRVESRTEEVMERFLARRRIVRKVRLTTPHFASTPLIVAQSDLVVTVPVPLARHYAAMASNVRIIELPFQPPSIDLKQFWHRRFDKEPRNQWLRSHVFAQFEARRRQGA
jgi:DNA-binding transcriptional LysR family regulator